MSKAVRLPRLTREELVALGDRPVLVDADDQAWWDGLDAGQREEVTATAWRGLLARDLARHRKKGEGIQVDGRLTFIRDVRAAPAWLAVATAETTLRAYGIDLPEGPYVLIEHRPTPGIAHFVGAKADPGVEAVVTYLLRAPGAGEGVRTRRLEVVHPEPHPDTQRRILLVGDHEARIATVAADGVAGDPVPTDPAALRTSLLEMIGRPA
jgi:hypothetical protein